MKYIFTLHDTTNGYEKKYYDDFDWDDEGDMLYQWLEGNYSCDCNRLMFLYDWIAEKHLKCGEGTIKIIKIQNEKGELVLPEDEEKTGHSMPGVVRTLEVEKEEKC